MPVIKNKQYISDTPVSCKTSINVKINPETIPNIITQKKLKLLTEGDPNPYFVVEEIPDIRELANGIEYIPEFWKSFLSKMKDAPLPGAKSGHTSPYAWWASGPCDLCVVGGELKGNSVYLKMYIPPFGQDSSNETFIKAVKAGMVHFSIVTYPELIVEYDGEGEIVSEKAIRSVKGERNDAVERNTGAMDQIVNKPGGKPPDEHIKKPEVKNMPDIKISDLKTSDIIRNLQNRLANGSVNKLEIAKQLNIEVVTDEHKEAVKTVSDIVGVVGEKPLEKVQNLMSNTEEVKKQIYKNNRDAIMNKEFGPVEKEIDGTKVQNLCRQTAELLVSTKVQTVEELKKQVNAAKENQIVLDYQKKNADVFSDPNLIKTPLKNKGKEDGKLSGEFFDA